MYVPHIQGGHKAERWLVMKDDFLYSLVSVRLGAVSLLCVVGSLVALSATGASVDYTPLSPPVFLPDGSQFVTWSDATKYTKTYHVNQNHPRASDDNPGTQDRPFRTINRAAQVVKSGERVLIHSGVYREMVRPRFSGEGPDRMIAYESAPGAVVVIKGSRVLEKRWQRSRDPHAENRHSLFSKKLWMMTLPDELFEDGYFPFRTPNASDTEIDLMPWALRWKGRIPYTLRRGLIFQDDRRMTQLATYEDLVRLPGAFWVDDDGKTVHIHPYGSRDPNSSLFEVATQSHIIKPEKTGLSFIRISGLTLEHAANGFPRIGVGALLTMGGHHWIIENNVVRHVNSVAIEVGYSVFERRDPDPRNVPRQDPNLGHVIVRNNRVYDCGTGGIQGYDVMHTLVENNDIRRCGWQDAEFYWECAAIKLLINTGTLVRGNTISQIEAAGGIWLDWNNKNSRVTGNIIHEVQTAQGAIFVEASQHPNLVDNNFIWNIDGQGIRAADTDELIIAHNLITRTTEDVVVARVATDRSLGGRRLTSERNKIVNNLFLDIQKPILFGSRNNEADYNVYATTGEPFDLEKWRQEGWGKHSVSLRSEAQFDPVELIFKWKAEEVLPEVPILKYCTSDFFGQPRDSQKVVPGPFVSLPTSARIELIRSR